jgi:hypothetical protein
MYRELAIVITVAVYLLAAWMWARNGGRWTWGRRSMVGSGVLLLAAADRYFEFSRMSADFLREMALEQGWYDMRRWLQTAMACLIVIVISLSALMMSSLGKRRSASNSNSGLQRSARTLCLMTLLGFCSLRALSNHFIDAWLSIALVGVSLRWIIEWLLLGLVVLSAFPPSLPDP